MTPKERNIIAQHWQSVITRESRDLASLAQIAARAMADRDVQADATLRGLILADVERFRADFERDQRSARPSTTLPESRPKVRRSDDLNRRIYSSTTPSPQPHVQPQRREPVRVAFEQLAHALGEWLSLSHEGEARAILEKMRALRGENPEVIPAAALQQPAQLIERLRTRLEHVRDQISALAQQAVAASGQGDEQTVAKLMRRLSAIHVSHRRLLDEAQLEQIRDDIIRANEQHQDGLMARKLVERERAVAAEIMKVAAAVHEFHRVVCAVPGTSAEFGTAQATYFRALQEVRAHDTEWLAAFVLELADLLAESSIPSPAAEKQIDHFLENVRLSLNRIHAEMGEIDVQRGESQGP